jgi:hypothetical protein
VSGNISKKRAKKTTELEVLAPRDKDRPTREDPIEYWVAWVAAPWQKSVEHIIETGVRLTELKEVSGHGNWMEIVKKELGWSQRMADMLMAIGRSFANWKHVSNLPPSWGTLYELTKWDEATLLEKVESGEINPGTERQEVGKLRAGKKKKDKADPWMKFQKAADKFFTEVQSVASTGSLNDMQYGMAKATRDEIVSRLDALMVNLDAITKRRKKTDEGLPNPTKVISKTRNGRSGDGRETPRDV